MADEKKKPVEEISEEELKDVSGGIIDVPTVKKTKLPLDNNIAGSGQSEDITGSAQGGE